MSPDAVPVDLQRLRSIALALRRHHYLMQDGMVDLNELVNVGWLAIQKDAARGIFGWMLYERARFEMLGHLRAVGGGRRVRGVWTYPSFASFDDPTSDGYTLAETIPQPRSSPPSREAVAWAPLLQRLSVRQRVVIEGLLDGDSLANIAQRMRVTVNTVNILRTRSVQVLRAHVGVVG